MGRCRRVLTMERRGLDPLTDRPGVQAASFSPCGLIGSNNRSTARESVGLARGHMSTGSTKRRRPRRFVRLGTSPFDPNDQPLRRRCRSAPLRDLDPEHEGKAHAAGIATCRGC